MSIRYLDFSGAVNFWTNIKNYILSKIPTKTSELTNDSGFLTQHQSLSNYVTLNTAQEITNTKTFKDTTTARKLTSVEAGNVIPSSDKLISDIWQDKNGKELGRIYYTKTKGGNTALIMRAGDWFTSNEGVYTLDASGTNRRAELQLYTDSSGNCCIKPNGLFSAHIKPLDSSVYLGDSTKPFGRVYANSFQFCNASLLPDTDVQATEEHSVGFFGKNNTPLSYITFQKRPSFKDRVAIRVQTSPSAYKSYDFDATCFYPESSNSVDIGSTTNIFKNIYCNNYYKGTTAFGDIVTHNASEFLTSHQSLANYLTKTTNVSEMGRYIDLHYDNATSKYDYDVRLYVDSQGTAAGGGSFKIAAASAYAPAPASNANDTRIATTAWVNSKGYLTSHPSITLSSNTTSTASPAHGGTFTCIDSVTQDTNGHITKVNTKTVTLPSDNNTDTLMTQNVSTTNSTYPILLCPTANATSNQGAKTGIFAKSVKINPSTNVVSASGFSGPLTGNVTGNCSGSSGSCTGNAATATQFSANTTVALTGDATGTSAGSKKGWSVPVTLANSGVTAGTYGPSADVTGNNNATISVPEITVDAKGRVTSVTNRTYTSVNTDTNTDTKVTQTVTTANSGYPVLLCATANATTTETTTSRFSAGLTINTRYSAINMTNKYDTANTKGVRNTSTYSNGYIIFRCYDASEMGTIRCESSKNGYQQTYMQAKSYIKNGAISPEGTATTCYITVRVRDNGSKTIYTDGSWENSLTPYANNTHSLGTSSLQWKNAYAVNIYENGTALSDKYLTVSAITGGASTSAGNITPVIGTIIIGLAQSTSASYSTNIGAVLTSPAYLYYAVTTWDSNTATFTVAQGSSVGGSGTWKLIGGGPSSPGIPRMYLYGLWVKIA